MATNPTHDNGDYVTLRRAIRRFLGRGKCRCGANEPNECPFDYPGDCHVSWMDAETWAKVLALKPTPLPGKPLPVCCCPTNPVDDCPVHGIGNGPRGRLNVR